MNLVHVYVSFPRTCTRCSLRNFVFREGDLTSGTVARKLQKYDVQLKFQLRFHVQYNGVLTTVKLHLSRVIATRSRTADITPASREKKQEEQRQGRRSRPAAFCAGLWRRYVRSCTTMAFSNTPATCFQLYLCWTRKVSCSNCVFSI